MRYHHVTHLLSSKEARVYSFQLQDLSGGRWQASEHAFFWNQLPKKLIIVWQWQDVLSGWSLLMEGVCVEASVFVFTYLLHWGLPAHVFKRGRSEPCCARGPLLKKQNHTFGVLSQFNNEVFQLPSHLVYGHTHTNQAFSILTVSAELEIIQVVAVSVILTTVWRLTWMTSSPAWIFLVRSAGD